MNLVKEITAILLNKRGQGTLGVHMMRGIMGTLALKVINTVLVLGTSLFLARLLGAKEYGIYAYAISWASLLSIPAVIGLNTLLVREVARYKALEDWGALRGILQWSDRVVLVTSAVFIVLFALIIWFLQGKYPSEVRITLWISIPLVPLLSFLLLRQGGLQGLGYVVEAQIPQFFVLPGIFLILVSGAYSISDLSVNSIVGFRNLAGLIAISVAIYLLRKHLPKTIFNASPKYCQKKWLKSALSLFFVGAAVMINQRISTVMVGVIIGPEAAGIFDIAFKASILVNFTQLIISWPLAPAVADLHARANKQRLQRLVTKSARVGLIGSLAIALIYIIFGEWVLFAFGSDFIQGFPVLIILTVSQLISVVAGPIIPLLNMSGYERTVARWIALGTILNATTGYPLILSLGTMGAAVSNMLSMVTWNLFLWLIACKELGVNASPLVFAGKE